MNILKLLILTIFINQSFIMMGNIYIQNRAGYPIYVRYLQGDTYFEEFYDRKYVGSGQTYDDYQAKKIDGNIPNEIPAGYCPGDGCYTVNYDTSQFYCEQGSDWPYICLPHHGSGGIGIYTLNDPDFELNLDGTKLKGVLLRESKDIQDHKWYIFDPNDPRIFWRDDSGVAKSAPAPTDKAGG